ncbi:unnamed protein product, partial [Pylaiella littoralis]
HYREQIIPTALELYASLPQDVLEGVDLEVGHTLPESMFVVTGTARPSWPRWGENLPSTGTGTATSPTVVAGGEAGAGGTGNNSPGSRGGGAGMGGGGRGNGMGCTEGRDGSGGGRAFLQGPWVVFRVAREEYLEFYGGQAAVLDQAVGGSAAELEHMLM